MNEQLPGTCLGCGRRRLLDRATGLCKACNSRRDSRRLEQLYREFAEIPEGLAGEPVRSPVVDALLDARNLLELSPERQALADTATPAEDAMAEHLYWTREADAVATEYQPADPESGELEDWLALTPSPAPPPALPWPAAAEVGRLFIAATLARAWTAESVARVRELTADWTAEQRARFEQLIRHPLPDAGDKPPAG